MSDPRDTPAARIVPRPRGEGQWGLGYHEPLNGAEQIKKDDDGLNVRERIDRIGASAIDRWRRKLSPSLGVADPRVIARAYLSRPG